MRFLDHTQRRTTFGRTPLDERSPRRRDLSLLDNTQQTDIHAPGGIRTHNPGRQATADPRPRPRGHWDQPTHQNNLPQFSSSLHYEYKINPLQGNIQGRYETPNA